MATRRDVLFGIAAFGFALSTQRAVAAPPVVEVLAMAHSPVQAALKPVRELLASLDGRVRVVELDIESPEGEKRANSVGLKASRVPTGRVLPNYGFEGGGKTLVEAGAVRNLYVRRGIEESRELVYAA